MKKLLATILVCSLLLPFPASARLLQGQQVVYRGTITGLRISAVDGNVTASGGAFIDNAGAAVTDFADGNHLVEIYDANGRSLRGVLKAVGTEETLSGVELVTNGTDFTGGPPPTGWSEIRSTLAATTGGESGNCLQLTKVTDNPVSRNSAGAAQAVGALIRQSGYVKSGSAGSQSLGLRFLMNDWGSDIRSTYITSTTSWVQITQYGTTWLTYLSPSFVVQMIGSATGTALFDTLSMQQVLTPSTGGATIVNGKGSNVYNFKYKNAAFTYNQSAYTVIIKKIQGENIVASGSYVSGAYTDFVRGDFTTTNAFVEIVGINLANYVGTDAGSTPYKVRLWDTTGRMAEGYLGAGGAGPTLSDELSTDPGFDNATKWTPAAGWTIGSGVLTGVTAASTEFLKVGTLPNATGKLYKLSIEIVSRTAGTVANRLGATADGVYHSTTGVKTDYLTGTTATANPGGHSIRTIDGFSGVIDNVSEKQVTDPPASTSGGFHITSAKNGIVRAWNVRTSAAIDYNSISKYQIIRE